MFMKVQHLANDQGCAMTASKTQGVENNEFTKTHDSLGRRVGGLIENKGITENVFENTWDTNSTYLKIAAMPERL